MTSLTLRVAGGNVHAELCRFGRLRWSAHAPAVTPDELRESVAALAGLLPAGSARSTATIVFDRPVLQVRALRGLPPARRSRLRRLIAAEPARFFRVSDDSLVTDVRWAGSWLRNRRTRAIGVAVGRAWVAAAVDGLGAAGFRTTRVGAARAIAPAMDLALPEQHSLRHGRSRARLLTAGAAAALVWALHGTASEFAIRTRIAKTEAELTSLRAPVAALLELRHEIATGRQMVEAVAADAAAGAAMSGGIARLVIALPDSAYLDAVSLDSTGGVSASGEAASPAAVAAALEQHGAGGLRLEANLGSRTTLSGKWTPFSVSMDEGP